MPYIKQERREELEQPLIELDEELCIDGESFEGNMNYSITYLMNNFLKREGVSYKKINALVGMLECCKLELYRKMASPYEDEKEDENGPVIKYPK